jgi:hypothetical protein
VTRSAEARRSSRYSAWAAPATGRDLDLPVAPWAQHGWKRGVVRDRHTAKPDEDIADVGNRIRRGDALIPSSGWFSPTASSWGRRRPPRPRDGRWGRYTPRNGLLPSDSSHLGHRVSPPGSNIAPAPGPGLSDPLAAGLRATHTLAFYRRGIGQWTWRSSPSQ